MRVIAVSGTAPAPELDLIVADNGDFGRVCLDSFKDLPLTLLNSGPCPLTIFDITSSASEFLPPKVVSYPVTLAPGTSVAMPVRFAPSSFGAKSATITVTSDDPTGVKSVAFTGVAPSGKLAVTGSTCIGGVKECCLGERTIAICNVGECELHVTSVAFKRRSRHWKLINNPFPATLQPGSCLSVLIRYKATERCPRACELVITSDDPATPIKTLDVMAYTIPGALRRARSAARTAARGAATRRTTRAAARKRSTAAATTKARNARMRTSPDLSSQRSRGDLGMQTRLHPLTVS